MHVKGPEYFSGPLHHLEGWMLSCRQLRYGCFETAYCLYTSKCARPSLPLCPRLPDFRGTVMKALAAPHPEKGWGVPAEPAGLPPEGGSPFYRDSL